MRNLNELVIFTSIVQEASFTRAADALQISRAAVSKAVAGLESRLGARLFERTTRRLRLTEAGEVYLTYAERAMEEANDGETAIARLTEKPRGLLRVAMPVTLAQASVAPKLARFLRQYPELRLNITLRGGQMDPIAERVDVVFQTAKPISDSRMIQRRMITVAMGIYASVEYLTGAPPLREPQDLMRHSCITLRDAHEGTSWAIRKDGATQEVRLRATIAIGDPMIHLRLCLDGAGIAILPNWVVSDRIPEGKIVRVLAGWNPAPLELYVLYPTRLSMTPKLSVFLKFIEDVLPKS